MASIASTALAVSPSIAATRAVTSSVARAVSWARSLTSPATTAKPLPASPARAASIVAFRASRFVCSAMPAISRTTSAILVVETRSSSITPVAVSVRPTPSRPARAASWALLEISLIEAPISSAPAATVCTTWVMPSAATLAGRPARRRPRPRRLSSPPVAATWVGRPRHLVRGAGDLDDDVPQLGDGRVQRRAGPADLVAAARAARSPSGRGWASRASASVSRPSRLEIRRACQAAKQTTGHRQQQRGDQERDQHVLAPSRTAATAPSASAVVTADRDGPRVRGVQRHRRGGVPGGRAGRHRAAGRWPGTSARR